MGSLPSKITPKKEEGPVDGSDSSQQNTVWSRRLGALASGTERSERV